MPGPYYANSIPGAFIANGVTFPVEIDHVDGPIEFNLAKHTPVNFTESYIEPQGAEGQPINARAYFSSAYFEGHKVFVETLKSCVIPNVPGVLNHPIYGPITCYPRRVNPIVDATTLEAVVEVTFERHFVKPEVPIVMGPFILATFNNISVPLSCAAYLSALAFMAAWNSAWISGALMFLRAGAVLDIVSRIPETLGAQFSTWAFSHANLYADTRDPKEKDPAASEVAPDAFARAMAQDADALIHRFLQSANISEAAVDAIALGGAYDGGVFHGQQPTANSQQPSPRFHAALLACTIFESQTALACAARLARILARQAQDQAVDPAQAESSITFARRRLSRASRLAGAALGINAAPIARDCSYFGAQLLKLIDRFPVLKSRILEKTVMDERPLALLALEWLGDASRAPEIRTLNSGLVADFNRLPRGTVLKVPA